MFYSILGGSPGSFGVVTQYELSFERDADHSVGFFSLAWPYDPTLPMARQVWGLFTDLM